MHGGMVLTNDSKFSKRNCIHNHAVNARSMQDEWQFVQLKPSRGSSDTGREGDPIGLASSFDVQAIAVCRQSRDATSVPKLTLKSESTPSDPTAEGKALHM